MINCVIIDDEPLAREGIGNYVREIDFLNLLGICENPLDLIKLLDQHRVDLIFLDIQMPKMNGIDATRAIRALPNYAATPILAMTANAFDEDRQVCIDAGMNEHIGKPVVPEKLFETLLKWLSKEKQFH